MALTFRLANMAPAHKYLDWDALVKDKYLDMEQGIMSLLQTDKSFTRYLWRASMFLYHLNTTLGAHLNLYLDMIGGSNHDLHPLITQQVARLNLHDGEEESYRLCMSENGTYTVGSLPFSEEELIYLLVGLTNINSTLSLTSTTDHSMLLRLVDPYYAN